MTTDQVLFGVGPILVLAVGSQVLASRLRPRQGPQGMAMGFTRSDLKGSQSG